MSDPTTASPDQTSLPIESAEVELGNLVKHENSRSPGPLETNAERIRASLARLSSSSIDDLEALTAELKKMQDFLKAEVEGVHRQIEGALAGINIIIDTIAPWKNAHSDPPAANSRAYRAGPAANTEFGSSRRAAGGI
jgi:hypothetical protein